MPAPTDSIEISALTAGAALDGTEIVPIVQAAATVRTTFSAALTYFNANASLDAARITAGTLAVARGGTNIGSYAVGDLLYASGATTLAKLAGVATGNALISGGVATAPSWGKIDLTTHITGILPSANGGTGVNNAGTITNASNTTITGGGTLALGGFTLTVPATGSAALLAVANVFTALQTTKITDAATNTTTVLATLNHASSGTPAASFGAGLKFSLESTTTEDQDAAQIEALWTTATHATRTSNLVFSLVNSAAALAEVARLTPTQAIFPAGSSTVPGVTFIGNTTDGIARVGGMSILVGGSLIATFASNRSQFNSGAALAWGNGNSSVAIDTTLRRNAAGVLEIGTDANNAGRWGSLKAGTYDAGTTTITDGLTLGHQSTGTPAAGFGAAIQINLNSSTTADQNAVRLTSEWVVATHASRTARYKINVYDTASRECLRAEASGSAPMIGFLGANAAIQQTGGAQTATGTYGATEQDMLQKAYDALRTFGLLT